MYLLLVIAIFIILIFLFVDRKQLKEYYPTIQFYIICNLLYNFIFYQHTLWSYKPDLFKWLNHTNTEIMFTFLIIPLFIIVYLRFFPIGWKGIAYIVIWIISFWLIEYYYLRKGFFVYKNGWNEWWSMLFNVIMYPTLYLHYKKPLIGILVSIPIIILLLLFFHPPLSELK